MDRHGSERVALLSIRPEFATAIFAGRKTVEFRRSRLAPDIELALVYATQPTGLIIGWFQISGIAESTPNGLWRRFRRDGAIRRRDFFTYFDGVDRAYAIEIASPTTINQPLTLDEIVPGMRPPQSFQYLPADLASRILSSPTRTRAHGARLRPAFG